ncbi:MAG: PepSY domain-containing protein [bacterium]|nr:PepSY domain-containing protein [bacterium]
MTDDVAGGGGNLSRSPTGYSIRGLARKRWRFAPLRRILRGMRWFRLLWLMHRWLGVAAGLILLLSALTGLLLLVKKDFDCLQPPVTVGQPGPVAELQPLSAVIGAVMALDLPQFETVDDIARIDFRPSRGVHKVLSKHDHLEVQVCAATLATSVPRERTSDWLEALHDGSWFGDFAHDRVMPVVALVLLYLATSGYVMWLWPKWLKRRRARRAVRS